MIMRAWATKQIYDIIVRAMKVRKQSGIPQNDALQMLLDSGEEHFTNVGVSILLFEASALFTSMFITSL
jgi:sterol 14-demethylase